MLKTLKKNLSKVPGLLRRKEWAAIGVIAVILFGLASLSKGTNDKPEPLSPLEKLHQLTSKKPDFEDALKRSIFINQWPVESDENGSCVFRNGAYYVTSFRKDISKACMSGRIIRPNFILQVQMSINKGYIGGLFFRWNRGSSESSNNYYYYYIQTDGTYGLSKRIDPNYSVVGQDVSPVINKGQRVVNHITVMASGHNFDLFANDEYLASFTDATHSVGQIGLGAGILSTSEVAFSNVKMWFLPNTI